MLDGERRYQVLFNDSTNQLWAYTPAGSPNATVRPVVSQIKYNGGGVFTLSGKQLNGPSDGSGYGDDVQTNENYPIVRLLATDGDVFYCRSTNWSSIGVGPGAESVNFTLNPAVTPGTYSLVVSGAGVSSFPVSVEITAGQVRGD